MCQVGELLEASQVGELLEVQVHLPTNKHFATTTLLQAFKNNHNQINAVQCYFCYCFLLYCCCYFGLVCSVKCLTEIFAKTIRPNSLKTVYIRLYVDHQSWGNNNAICIRIMEHTCIKIEYEC